MAINILEGDNKRKYILIVLGFLVACLIVFVVWRYVLPKFKNNLIEQPLGYLNITINFTPLTSLKIKELNLFQNIQPFSGDFGRVNPFEQVAR